jgi:RHS repeat-associated protein
MELRTKVGAAVGVVVVGLVAFGCMTRSASVEVVATPTERPSPRPAKPTKKAPVVATEAPAPRVVAPVVAPTPAVQIERDARGRPTRFEAGELVEGVRRDASGRLVEAFAGQEVLRFTHDDDGHVRVVDDRAGVTLDYDRDASNAGEVREVVRTPYGTTTWTRDALGRVVGLATPAGAFRFGYDAAGVPTSIEAPNGVRSTWSAQPGRDAILAASPAGEVLNVERRLDQADRVAQVRRDGALAQAAHDDAGRLVAWTSQGQTTRFAYDADGARLVADAEQDAAGRLVRHAGDRFAYDAFGRLSRVERAGRPAVAFTYDPFGRVATRTVGDATTRFVYEGARLLAQLGPDGARRTFVYGPGLDVPLAYKDGEGAWTHLHADAQGHVLAYSDEAGACVDRAAFDPWGVLEGAPAADRPVFFSGRLVDRDAGLVNLRARWYDPALGRFLTRDPAGLRGGPSAWAYAAADPLRYIDPLGLWPEPSPLDHAEAPPVWLAERLAVLDRAMPRELQGAISDTAVVAWNELDPTTRESLRSPAAVGLWLAALDQKVGEAARGFEASHAELAFLAGEGRGLGNAGVALVHGVGEIGNFLVDLGAVTIAVVHDAAAPAGSEFLPHYEFKSGLSEVFARGEQGKLATSIFTEFDDRIAEASRKTGLLVEEGRHFEAGAAFGEGVLAETAMWLQLAGGLYRAGARFSSLSALERRALLKEAMSMGYQPGAGDTVLKELAARLKRGWRPGAQAGRTVAQASTAVTTASAATAAKASTPVAAAPARNGLAQVIDDGTARGAAPKAPKPVAAEPAPAKPAAPETTRSAPAEARPTAEPAPEAPSNAHRARGPPDAQRPSASGSADDELHAARQRLARKLHELELGRDPARGKNPVDMKFNPVEAEQGLTMEERFNLRLRRDPTGAGEWIDQNGVVYDAIGGGIKPGTLKTKDFFASIKSHLLKQGVDRFPIDFRGLEPARVAEIETMIAEQLNTAERARLMYLR